MVSEILLQAFTPAINKYASYLDWRNLHMPIAVTASGGQFVTRASRLPG